MTACCIEFPATRASRRIRGLAIALFGVRAALPASGQDESDERANRAWQAGAIAHAQRMRAYPDVDHGAQSSPPVIQKFDTSFDPAGLIATFQPGGDTLTSQNAFFANLGTNEHASPAISHRTAGR